jgi:fructose-1,6-bisphosphatase II
VAVAGRGTMYDPRNIVYMDKIAVGAAGKGLVHIEAEPAENLAALAKARDCDVSDLTVCVLERPRHDALVAKIRATGARLKLIPDGDVAGALTAAMEDYSGVDVLMGVGGSPEAVLAACALKCVGGEIQCRLWPRNEEEKQKAIAAGLDAREFDRVLSTDDLVRSDNVFFAATGITNGELLRGVQYFGRGARTHSLTMRSQSGTTRWIEAVHHWERLTDMDTRTYDPRIWRDRTRAGK